MSPVEISLFGLFVANMTNVSIPLTGVHYDVDVKSFATHITINQTYKNVESTDLECVYGFPINDQAAVVGLTVTVGNRTLTSQFKEKDQAFKDYTNALARNDGAYLLDQSDRSDDTFVLSVGRLPPGKEAIISISYVNTLESITETKLRLTIPTSLYPRYNPKPEAPKGVAPPEKYQNDVPYRATLTGHIRATDAILNVSSSTHPINVTTQGAKESTVTLSQNQPLDRDLQIDIELKNNPEHYVEVENTAAGNYTAMYAFVPNFKPVDAGSLRAELIFIVDCSGSMYDEGKIGDAKSAMQIFLRSIPEGSYFNFYRFGDSYQSLFNESQAYTAETFAKATDYASATDANLGGTEILSPLQKIYASPPRDGFSRQIFLMTDGEVSNTDDVIAIVRANAANTRLFSFGLGQSPSRSLINGVAEAGKGKPEFIKHGEELGTVVARQLSRSLQPSITNATVAWFGVKNVQQVPTNLPVLYKGDRQLVYAFFELDPAAGAPYIELQRGGTKVKVPIEIPVSGAPPTQAPFLDKLAARAMIKQVENNAAAKSSFDYTGSLQQTRAKPLTDEEVKAKITALSLTYGVLSKYVSLIAVENRSQEERANASKNMQLREVPIQKAEPPRPTYLYDSASNVGASLASGSYAAGPYYAPMPQLSFMSFASGPSGAMGASVFGFNKGFNFGSSAGSANQMSSSVASRPSSSHGGPSPDDSDNGSVLESTDAPSAFATSLGPADTTTLKLTASTAQLNTILGLQDFNGAWKFSPELEGATGVTQTEAKTGVTSVQAGLSDEVVSTLLAVAYLEEKYPAKADVWQTIVGKANAYLAKQSDATAVAAAKSALTALIKSK